MRRDALERFVTDLGTLYRARRLYPVGNGQVTRAAGRAIDSLRQWGSPVRISALGDEVVVEDRSFALKGSPLEPFARDLMGAGFDNVHLRPDLSVEDLTAWIEALLAGRPAQDLPGITAGVLQFPRGGPADRASGRYVASYLELLPAVEEAFADVAKEKRQGLTRAREIVAAIAGSLAVGEELLRPVRHLKGHDEYTFTHGLNVCVLATVLARSLAAPEDLVDQIALAGLCHDVGKQVIPIEVLNRPGVLSPEERRVMDGHPAHGARLLLTADAGIHPLLPVVAYQHHMGADGSGYPRVPSFRAPHPASLVIAVADVFDAMRTVRPYRGARSAGEACTALVVDAAKGRLNRRHVSTFLCAFRVLRPERRVALSDGRCAQVLTEGHKDALAPTVEAEDGEILDLSSPVAPSIVQVFDFSCGAPS